MPTCLIGLRSNLGNRREMLDRAVASLAGRPQVSVVAKSRWHETSPVGGPADQPTFCNGAAVIETSLGPAELLAALQAVENELGRVRTERWGPRIIDLDLLLFGDQVLETPSLAVPHPRMAWRRFVLEPAAEIAPSMVHPTTGWTVARLLEHLNTTPPYVAIAGGIGAGKTRLAEQLAPRADARLIAEQPDLERLEASLRWLQQRQSAHVRLPPAPTLSMSQPRPFADDRASGAHGRQRIAEATRPPLRSLEPERLELPPAASDRSPNTMLFVSIACIAMAAVVYYFLETIGEPPSSATAR